MVKAKAILAKQPTLEEIADHEARARRNRVDAIMTRQEPDRPLHYVRNDNALVLPTDDARPATRGYVDRQIDNLLRAVVARMALRADLEGLQERVAAIEPKPRVRVPALTRPHE